MKRCPRVIETSSVMRYLDTTLATQSQRERRESSAELRRGTGGQDYRSLTDVAVHCGIEMVKGK
jgi:hypothetical protein